MNDLLNIQEPLSPEEQSSWDQMASKIDSGKIDHPDGWSDEDESAWSKAEKSVTPTFQKAFIDRFNPFHGNPFTEEGRQEMNDAQRIWVQNQSFYNVAKAFGHGYMEAMVQQAPLDPDTTKYLKEAGQWENYLNMNDIANKSLMDGLIIPAARTGYGALRASVSPYAATLAQGTKSLFVGITSAPFEAATEALLQTGKELGDTDGSHRIGGALAAGLEYFSTADMARSFERLPPSVAKLKANRVLESDAVYFGTKEPTVKQSESINEAAAMYPEPVPVKQPTIHEAAREIDPIPFEVYDVNVSRREALRDQYAALREEKNSALEDSSPFSAEIADVKTKIESANPRKTKIYQERLDKLEEQHSSWVEKNKKLETPEMVKIKENLQEIDYKLQDLARGGRIAEAYRKAREVVPEVIEETKAPESSNTTGEYSAEGQMTLQTLPQQILMVARENPGNETPVSVFSVVEIKALEEAGYKADADGIINTTELLQEATRRHSEGKFENISIYDNSHIGPLEKRFPREESPTPVKNIEEQKSAIVEGVTKKLIEAGRPAEEANAAAQLIAEHYIARSERFQGRAGTPVEMYLRDSAEIKAGKTKKYRDLNHPEGGMTLLQKARGKIRLATENTRAIITLFKDANASTFIHETGHHWLDELMRDAVHKEAPELLRKDAEAVKKWLGISEDGRITAKQHETFARGFERRMMEGTSPSRALDRVFQQFNDWLTKIYQTVDRLKSPINDEIRGVMDRLLAANPEKKVIAPEAELGIKDKPLGSTAESTEQLAASTTPEKPEIKTSKTIPSAPKPEEKTKSGRPESPTAEIRPESELMDKAGNIRLENLTTNQDVREVLHQAARDTENFSDARHGHVSDAEVIDLADAMGVEAKELNIQKLREMSVDDGIPLAVRIRVGRKMLLESSQNVLTAMNKAAKSGDEADILTFAEARNRHLMIAETVSSVTEEWGRAGRAFRDISKETMNDVAAVTELFQNMTGKTPKEMLEIARKGAALDTPQAISKFMQDSKKPSFLDMITEFRINAMLSGPITHIKNMIGNGFVAINSVVESAGASLVGKVLGSKERVDIAEAKARWFGIFQGGQDGLIAAGKILKNEGNIAGSHTVEKYSPSIPGDLGKVIRIPTRLLSAEDEFFKAIGYRQELNVLAYRQAAKEGLSGDSFLQRITDITQNPSEEMMKLSRENAQYQTFTNSLGPTGRALQNLANSNFLLKNIIPFVRTPVNILKYAGERTPFGLLSKEIRSNLSGINGEIARDSQMARMAIGTTISAVAIKLALEGVITGGGPSDKGKRAIMMAEGWRPYSIKIGDAYYSYQWLDPFATTIGIPADLAEITQQGIEDEESVSKIIGMAVASTSKNLMSKLSLRGISDFIQTATDPDRYGERFLQSFAGSFIPSLIAQPTIVNDPLQRESKDIIDGIKSRLPGLREELMGKIDLWGELIPNQDKVGPDLISPIYESKLKNDPVNQRLLDVGYFPSKPGKKIRGIELTPAQYNDFIKISGKRSKMLLNNIVLQPGFSALPKEIQAKTMKSIIDDSRESIGSFILMKYPEIGRQALENKLRVLKEKKTEP